MSFGPHPPKGDHVKEDQMWTLIIVVVGFSGGLTGATSSTAFLDFTNKERCEAAATAVGVPSWASIASLPPRVQQPIGGYRIIAQCVQR